MNISEQEQPEGITEIAIRGYKSLAEERRFAIYPLTILAGANSSGKSSAMQPLLLLKQTLEASYDPGPLLLNGPNVRFTSAEQLLSRIPETHSLNTFSVELKADDQPMKIHFVRRQPKKGFDISRIRYGDTILKSGMKENEIKKSLPKELLFLAENTTSRNYKGEDFSLEWNINRERCFLEAHLIMRHNTNNSIISDFAIAPRQLYEQDIRRVIHVPGLRGNPERTYKTTAVGDEFTGTFENYVASIISHWQSTDDERLQQLSEALEKLGLTWGVEARQLDDTQVEIRVGRLKKRSNNSTKDLVNVSDVGFGVSQTLPVLVALLIAQPGQLVYIEQPEIHLHPRAQSAMAQILADAAKRGVRVVIETHSALLLLAVQTLVAEDYIPSHDVMLHWFKRRDDGVTDVTSGELDEAGAYGDWPEDFADTILEAEGRYLDAVEAQQRTA